MTWSVDSGFPTLHSSSQLHLSSSPDSDNDLSGSSMDQSVSYTTSFVAVTSPPTPSPSPRPCKSQCVGRPESAILRDVRLKFQALDNHSRHQFLAEILSCCSVETLVHVNNIITPRIKRDFLKDLPIEISLHIISFIHDPQSLARASAVSKYWHDLLSDEHLWKGMCKVHKYYSLDPQPCPSPRARSVRRLSLTSSDEDGSAVWRNRPIVGRISSDQSDEASATTPPTADLDDLLLDDASIPRIEYAVSPPLPAYNSLDDIDPSSSNVLIEGMRSLWGMTTTTSSPPSISRAIHSPPNSPSKSNEKQLQKRKAASSSDWEEKLFHVPSPLSFRQHFKISYLTESNWRKGGRIVRAHTFKEGTVTSVSMDSEWIVASLTNCKVYVFSAKTGAHVRNLSGHTQGIWALHLVSKGGTMGGPPPPAEAASDDEEDDGEEELDIPMGGQRRTSSPFVQPQGMSFGAGPSTTMPSAWPATASSSTSSSASTSAYATANSTPTPPAGFGLQPYLGFTGFGAFTGFGINSSTSSSNNSSLVGTPNLTSNSLHPMAAAQTNTAYPFPSTTPPSSPDPSQLRSSQQTWNSASTSSRGSRGKRPKTRKAKPDLPPLPAGLQGRQSDVCNASYGWGQEGALVLSGGCDRTLRVWDVRSGYCLHVLRGHTSTIRCIKVLDGRPIAVSASRDGVVKVWDVMKGIALRTMDGHEGSVRCLDVCGNVCVTGSYDATARMWNVDTGDCLRVFRGHTQQIYAIAFDGLRVATGSLDSTVRVWNAETGKCMSLLQGHTSLVGNVQILDDDLVTGGSDGRVIIFNLKTFATRLRICAHDNSVIALQVDNSYLITGGNDGCVKLFDRQTGTLVRELTETCEGVWKVLMRRDKCVIACKRGGNTVFEVLGFAPTPDQL